MARINQKLGFKPTVTPGKSANTFQDENEIHVYSFDLASKSPLNVALTSGDNLNAEVRLYRDRNKDGKGDKLIDDSVFNDNRGEGISLASVDRGTYIVELDWISGGDINPKSYELILSTAKPSNLLPTEVEFDHLTGTQTFNDSVGKTDTSDVYHFRVDTPINFSLYLTDLSTDADVRLIKDDTTNFEGIGIVNDNEVIERSILGGTTSESINRVLDSGDYFVQVYQSSGDTNYALSLTALWI